jgi:hypothetical protein
MNATERAVQRVARVVLAVKVPLVDISKYTPSEKLDVVLKYLQGIKEPAIQDIKDIQLGLREIGIEFTNLYLILQKLLKDGYVLNIPTDTFEQWPRYGITFEGDALLHLDDGYSGLLEKQNRASVLEKNNQKYLTYGTVGAAFFGSCLLVWDIVKFLIDKGISPKYYAETFFHLILFPCLFLVMWQIIKRLP